MQEPFGATGNLADNESVRNQIAAEAKKVKLGNVNYQYMYERRW